MAPTADPNDLSLTIPHSAALYVANRDLQRIRHEAWEAERSREVCILLALLHTKSIGEVHPLTA